VNLPGSADRRTGYGIDTFTEKYRQHATTARKSTRPLDDDERAKLNAFEKKSSDYERRLSSKAVAAWFAKDQQ